MPPQGPHQAEIAVANISLSSLNPRGDFEKTSQDMLELIASIRSKGIQQNLVVRQIAVKWKADAKEFEVVAGNRRLHAAKAAGLETVPCIVYYHLSDADATEIALIENKDRTDIHPLDQAKAIGNLHAKGRSRDHIAASLGVSLTYIAQRLELLNLVPSAAQLFRSGVLPLAHALEIARLQAPDQYLTIDKAIRTDQVYENGRSVRTESVCSLASLREIIRDDVHLALATAPFPTDQDKLVAGVVACTVCPKNSAVRTELFPDLSRATCLDRGCFHKKLEAHLKIVEKESKGRPVLLGVQSASDRTNRRLVAPSAVKAVTGKGCIYQRPAVYMEKIAAHNIGDRVMVCMSRECEVHYPKEAAAAKKERAGKMGGKPKTEEKPELTGPQLQAAISRERIARRDVFAAVVKKLTSPTSFETLTDFLLGKDEHWTPRRYKLLQQMVPTLPADIEKAPLGVRLFVIDNGASRDLEVNEWDVKRKEKPEGLHDLAKALGFNPTEIRKAALKAYDAQVAKEAQKSTLKPPAKK
jgi:ParB/RepB/Spo0J family partition protein